MVAYYSCPHCGTANSVREGTFEEILAERLPAGIRKGVAIVGETGVDTQGNADAINKYLDGVAVTCGKCCHEFKI